MRKSFVALLLLLGAAASMATLAMAQTSDNGNVGDKLVNLRAAQERQTRAARLAPARTSAVSESTWIGHSIQAGTRPGWTPANQVWGTDLDPTTYSYGPFHVGRGNNRPSLSYPAGPVADKNNSGLWDWDRFNADESDSLQGWWPMRRFFNRTDGPTNDVARPWLCAEIGNGGNYSSNSPDSRNGGSFGKQNFGVLSYWHVDPGPAITSTIPGTNPAAPAVPAGVAWCGLRSHGDLSVVDPIMGNAYNMSVLEFVGENGGSLSQGTSKGFPGYPGQMDQLLYTDVDVSSDAATLDLSFLYETSMSTTANTAATGRRGWFQFDPKIVGNVVTPGGVGMGGAPNFISNTGIGEPADSFMVYIGVPVDNGAVNLSDGSIKPVYDLKRRWLSEVIKLEAPIVEIPTTAGDGIFHKSGLSGPKIYNTAGGADDGNTGPIALAPFYDEGAGGTQRVRVVFRVHTNRLGDDENSAAFSSGKKGAVYIDDVSYTVNEAGGDSFSFDFNSGGIDNSDTYDDATVHNLRGTGKPPSYYFHTHPINGDLGRGYDALQWNDLCGPPNAIARFCNMDGVVMSVGNHDFFEGPGGAPTGSPADANGHQGGMYSPTINLMSTDDTDFNAMGINKHIATATDDYYVWYDIYTGIYDLFNKGNAWTYAFQAYPATQDAAHGSTRCWGERRIPGFQIFNPDINCLPDIEPARFYSLLATSNSNLVPDSLRLFMGNNQQCYRFAAVTTCPNLEGGYFDNLSVMFASKSGGSTATVALDIWMFLNDAFPTNDGTSADPNVATFPGTARFDTCGANLTIGLNNATLTGDDTRLTIPGDTMVVIGGVTGSTTGLGRVDMVFRVKPGVGNYVTVGDPNSGLRSLPTGAAQAIAGVTSGSGPQNFWAAYLANPGEMSQGVHGSPGVGPGLGANFWNRNVWNSARIDTADFNIWPVSGNPAVFNVNRAFGAATLFMAAYNENDGAEVNAKIGVLGIDHPICYLNAPGGASNSTNMDCSGTNALDASYQVNNPNDPLPRTTAEGSKVIPDGLLTPGAHVEYFFRAQNDGGTGNLARNDAAFVMCPDTNFVTPQQSEGPSTDGHRWQEFGILPDRWKDPTLGDRDDAGNPYGGAMACMLYVDNNDRRGNERAWVSVADSIGATSVAKRGGHNGWLANGGQPNALTTSTGEPISVSNTPVARVTHGGIAGSTWDMYGVKASESLTTSAGSLGGRMGPQGTGLATGKDGKNAPTTEMLRTYYKVLLILTGDLNSGILGPFGDRGANDLELLNKFMLVGLGNPPEKKAVLIGGDGFMESEWNTGHDGWVADMFGTAPKYSGAGDPQFSYKAWSGNSAQYADLITAGPIVGDVYSLGNSCLWTNDVLDLVANGTNPQVSAYYQNTGPGNHGPYIAGVYTPIQTGKFYESFVDGWDLEHLFSYGDFTSKGRLGYFAKVFSQIAGVTGLCQVQGTPLVDVTPISGGQQFVDFMQVRNNPMLTGRANVHFGLARPDKVTARVFDVSGRLVRTLADRNFPAGEHDLYWDGTDDGGRHMERGVYFTQLKYAKTGFVDAKKIAVLK